jgi:thioredoxin 1
MTEKRTQNVVDLTSNLEITTYDDGKVAARFELLNLEVLGSDEDHAKQLLLEVLQDRVNTDDDARERFAEWAKDHVIEVEVDPDDDVQGGQTGDGPTSDLEARAAEASSDFRELAPETFDAAIAGSKPVLVDFWAPWCQPCLRAAPVLKEIWDEHRDAFDVAKVNVENYPVFNERFSIQGIPCFVIFANGDEVDRIVGIAPKQQFWAEIERILAQT